MFDVLCSLFMFVLNMFRWDLEPRNSSQESEALLDQNEADGFYQGRWGGFPWGAPLWLDGLFMSISWTIRKNPKLPKDNDGKWMIEGYPMVSPYLWKPPMQRVEAFGRWILLHVVVAALGSCILRCSSAAAGLKFLGMPAMCPQVILYIWVISSM